MHTLLTLTLLLALLVLFAVAAARQHLRNARPHWQPCERTPRSTVDHVYAMPTYSSEDLWEGAHDARHQGNAAEAQLLCDLGYVRSLEERLKWEAAQQAKAPVVERNPLRHVRAVPA